MNIGALSSGIKRLDHRADCSPPPSAEVKYSRSYASTASYVFMEWCLIYQEGYFLSTACFWTVYSFSWFWPRSQNFEMRICLSICSFLRLSVCMDQFGSHWTDFQEIWYLNIFRKSVEIIEVFYMKTNVHFWSHLAQYFLEWELLHANVVEKIRSQILRSIMFFPKVVPLVG